MDAARYLAPQLRDLADFVIPLGDEPPRQLGCISKWAGIQKLEIFITFAKFTVSTILWIVSLIAISAK